MRSAVLLVQLLVSADAAIGYEGGKKVRNLGGVLCEPSKGTQAFGYTTISENKKYFHALINAEESSPNTPAFVYLPGGPGVSALGATLTLVGPCIVEADDLTLSLNKYCRYRTLLEVISTAPSLRENLHLVGASFDGSTATLLAQKIISLKAQSGIKLRSLIVLDGNLGLVDMYRGGVEMARNRKLLPQKTIAKMVTDGYTCVEKVKACQPTASRPDPDPSACEDAANYCGDSLLDPLDAARISRYDVRVRPGLEWKNYKLITGNAEIHMNDKAVQAAMGVSKKWLSSNSQVFGDFHKFQAFDTTKVVSTLLDDALQVIVFNGDQDFVTNSIGALYWLGSLRGTVDYGAQLAVAKDKPLEFKKGGRLGTIRSVKYATGGSLAFINVTDGSHTAVLNKPLEMHQAIEAVLSGAIWA
ncbi:hypothetical protein FOZ60_011257 [Perkinsus olseni]|uniref:Thymus-specific serine protease n=1 Tax=Perkinsus olseni TaxID=32597 RepID=A0A7J6NDZ4_PEROL|nr:hypothetical protein FOZ60_011257 [Perkinsus olseni]